MWSLLNMTHGKINKEQQKMLGQQYLIWSYWMTDKVLPHWYLKALAFNMEHKVSPRWQLHRQVPKLPPKKLFHQVLLAQREESINYLQCIVATIDQGKQEAWRIYMRHPGRKMIIMNWWIFLYFFYYDPIYFEDVIKERKGCDSMDEEMKEIEKKKMWYFQ